MTPDTVKRVVLIVLDSVGCGDAPDAHLYGDSGADTLGNIARAVGGLHLPTLGALGLGNITEIEGVAPVARPLGAYGRLSEISAGKDTTTGHWELAGVVLDQPFPVYPTGFPSDLMHKFEAQIGRGTLGNFPASGTEVIKELGPEHIRTGAPIVYTSADSVFQIAAHESIIDIDELYQMCLTARVLLQGTHAVGRVIARPFIGSEGDFTRTERRKDFSLPPPAPTLLDIVKDAGRPTLGIGKIEDIFAYRGLTASDHTGNNAAGVAATLAHLAEGNDGLIFVNLVDFDSLYGHRNDPIGYARALAEFDRQLPLLLNALKPGDVLIITADHGNDPTRAGTDHTRERVPILVVGAAIKPSWQLGTRASFSDVAATAAGLLGIPWNGPGDSFSDEVLCDPLLQLGQR